MNLLHIQAFLLLVLKLSHSDGARILGIFPHQGRSHFVMGEQLFKSLAKRGHQVDVISHFPLEKPFPNYTDVVNLNGTTRQLVNGLTFSLFSRAASVLLVSYGIASMLGKMQCELLGHPQMQELINNPPTDPPYDLVITEILGAHCYMAFGHLLKVPVVGVTTCEMYPWANDAIGNPDNTAYVPNIMQGFSGTMSFWERLANTVASDYQKITFNYFSAVQNDIVRKYFGEDAPGIRELERSVALILTNSHHSLNGVKPYTPAVVEVGGLHVQDDGPELSPALNKWLDESEKGVVYFTFGSMMRIESMPAEKLQMIYKSLAKIAPVRVLMKVMEPKDLPPGLPDNVLTFSWISQIKVLKHKNTRAFLTHGGLMGTQEAVYHGIPLVGMPLFGDQDTNVRTCVEKKIAVAVDYSTLTTEKMDAALDAVLNDPNYMKATKKLSAQFKDRPMSAADTATFWIEYVIRNGPTALRSPVLDLTWWQVALIDVYGVLLALGLLIGYLLKIITRKLTAAVFKKDAKKVLESKKTR